MTAKEPQTSGAARRYLPVLLLLFAASGCSALIYEIVWYQLLQLVIGSTAVSLGVLLATFMGGLCLGSLALPRLARARDMHPLRVYGLVELGIGACGILALVLIPLLDSVYVAAVGHGHAGNPVSRVDLRHLPAAAHHADGGIAAGGGAMGGVHPGRRLVAGISLWRQHRGRGLRLPAGRLLSAARVRPDHGYPGRGGHQRRGRAGRVSCW